MRTDRENAILRKLSELMEICDIEIECFKNVDGDFETMVKIEGNDILYIPKGTSARYNDVMRCAKVRQEKYESEQP